MAAVVFPTNDPLLAGTTMSFHPQHSSTTTQQQQLRRAVYVHVSDLTSAYNIDHAMLEEELARVKADQQQQQFPAVSVLGAVPTELDTGASHRRLQPPRIGYNLCV